MDKIYQIVDHTLILKVKGKQVEVDLRQLIWPCSAFSLLYLLFWRKSGFKDVEAIKKLEYRRVDGTNDQDLPYQPKAVNIPPLKGWVSAIFRKLSRSPFGRAFLLKSSKKKGELDLFLNLDIPDEPTYFPIVLPEEELLNSQEKIDVWSYIKTSVDADEFHFNTVSDYIEAYGNGTNTPTNVAKNVIAAIKDSESRSPRLRIIIEFHESDILDRAAESTERWKANNPLSVFDGVPVAVKDEIFLAGYPCRAGLPIEKFGKHKTLSDEGFMVRKLREGGAVFIGMANMHQLGSGITGINPSKHHGTARNPYNTSYPPGGSSSGPSAAVACGMCPIALGADGGGSIRIPSAANGIVGAKCSFSRISQTGLHTNCDTVSHAGALCATARDSAIFYGYVAGKDPEFLLGLTQPPPSLKDFENTNLEGITIGIDWNFFNDCHPEVGQLCKKSIDYLVENCHAKVVEISIPEIQETNRAHVVATLTEMYTYSRELYHKYHDEINSDTEINLSIGESFTSAEYFLSQKQRTRSMKILKGIFKKVDCFATPAFGDFMPKLDADSLKHGYNNLKHLTDVIRFCVMGNLTGHPSIAAPVGYASGTNLPVGLLIQTAWWREDIMFRISHALEGAFSLQQPTIYYDVLKDKLGEDSYRGSPSSSKNLLE